MRVIARVEGTVPAEWLRSRSRLAARAITIGMDAVTTGAAQDARAMVRAAKLGNRLAGAVQAITYPRPPRYSMRAAGEIVVSGRVAPIIQAFEEGAVITPKGKYLAVPTPAVSMGFRQRPTVRQVEARYVQKLEYRVIGGRPCLVLPLARLGRTGRLRAASGRQIARGRAQAVVAFWLVPSVTITKRLDLRGVARAWMRRLPGLIDRAAAGLRG